MKNILFAFMLLFSLSSFADTQSSSSKIASNIQLLCAKHNLKKGARFV